MDNKDEITVAANTGNYDEMVTNFNTKYKKIINHKDSKLYNAFSELYIKSKVSSFYFSSDARLTSEVVAQREAVSVAKTAIDSELVATCDDTTINEIKVVTDNMKLRKQTTKGNTYKRNFFSVNDYNLALQTFIFATASKQRSWKLVVIAATEFVKLLSNKSQIDMYDCEFAIKIAEMATDAFNIYKLNEGNEYVMPDIKDDELPDEAQILSTYANPVVGGKTTRKKPRNHKTKKHNKQIKKTNRKQHQKHSRSQKSKNKL